MLPSTSSSKLEDGNLPQDKIVCKLCKRQFSKYTCPTCNVPYCSLTCFRSEAHNQCAEGFFKKEIEADINSEPAKSAQERTRMLQLLKRFEEESPDDDLIDQDEDDDNEDDNELSRRLEGVDLESTSTEKLWALLSQSERDKFTKLLNNPTGDLAQNLLASEEVDQARIEPWWEAPSFNDESVSNRKFGPRPVAMSIPTAMVKPVGQGPPLIYNICAICIAYAYATRHLAISPLSSLSPEDPDHQEARKIISRLVPFLMDNRATTLHANFSSVATDIWSRFEPGVMTPSLFSVLLSDTARLLSPLYATPATSPISGPVMSEDVAADTHSHLLTILVLSDISRLFEGRPPKAAQNHVTHKVRFYAATVLSSPGALLRIVSREARRMAKGVKGPEVGEGRFGKATVKRLANAAAERKESLDDQLIVEMM